MPFFGMIDLEILKILHLAPISVQQCIFCVVNVAAGAFFYKKTMFFVVSVAAGAFFCKKTRFRVVSVAAGAFF
jgi:hypothetical protein